MKTLKVFVDWRENEIIPEHLFEEKKKAEVEERYAEGKRGCNELFATFMEEEVEMDLWDILHADKYLIQDIEKKYREYVENLIDEDFAYDYEELYIEVDTSYLEEV